MANAENAERQRLSFRQWGALIAIMCIYFFGPTFSAVSSTLSLIPDFYGVDPAMASWISAMANPSACVAGLVMGLIAGKRMSYRACMILALVLFIVFGGLPFLWQGIPFWMLLVARLLFGLGCGCFTPVCQAIITHMFKSETARSAWIGIVNVVFSIGASAGTLITGALSNNGVWQNAYAFYLFAVIPLILVFIFFRDKILIQDKSIAEDPEDKEVDTSAPKEKRHVPAVAWCFIVIFGVSTILTQTFFNYTGIAMDESGANTLLIGTVFTVFTVVGIVVAAANTAFWRFLRLYNMPVAFLTMALCYVFCLIGYSTGSTAIFFLASIVCGIGCCLAGLVMPMVMSVSCAATVMTFAIGCQEVARNLGSFLSAPWLNIIGGIFGDTATIQFTAALILGIIGTIVAFIFAARWNKQYKNVEMEKK